MGSNRDDDEPVSGELMRAEDNNRAPAKRSAGVPVLRTIFATFSRLPFKNFWEQKRIASVREVIKEETELFKEAKAHQQAFNVLDNIDFIVREDNAALEANAIAEENRVAEQKRKEGARKKDNEIYEAKKEAELKQAIHEAEMQDLERRTEKAKRLKDVADAEKPDPAEMQTRGSAASKKQAEITKEIRRHEKEKGKIENGGDSPEAKKRLLKAALGSHEQELAAIDEKYKRRA